MSSHATTGNTQATGRFSVRNATGPSRDRTTLLSTWRDTYDETWRWELKAPEINWRQQSKLFLKTIICLQAVVKGTRQAVVFTAKKSITPSRASSFSPEADPPAGDSTRPLSQGCKLLWKGPNWNLSYLTDKTWRTRCQQLFNWKCIFCQGNQEQQTNISRGLLPATRQYRLS